MGQGVLSFCGCPHSVWDAFLVLLYFPHLFLMPVSFLSLFQEYPCKCNVCGICPLTSVYEK